jgi:LysM repeat protein
MRIKDKWKFVSSITLLIGIVVVIIAITTNITKEPTYTESYSIIHVTRGETLWSIAEEYKKPNTDTREYIYEIRKLNDMETSEIYEGQTLQIIVYTEVK